MPKATVDLESELGKGYSIQIKKYNVTGVMEYWITLKSKSDTFGVKLHAYQEKDSLLVTQLLVEKPNSSLERTSLAKTIVKLTPFLIKELKKDGIKQITGKTNQRIANLSKRRLGADVQMIQRGFFGKQLEKLRKKLRAPQKRATHLVRLKF